MVRGLPRLRLSPQLSKITLENVLSGDTCEPISLADFEAYLTYKEHTPENLRFVVWYQDYRRRFFALPPDVQRRSPGPSALEFDFGVPNPARMARRAASDRFAFAVPVEGEAEQQGGDGRPSTMYSMVTEATSLSNDATTLDGTPLTPTSTGGLLRTPSSSYRRHSIIPGVYCSRRQLKIIEKQRLPDADSKTLLSSSSPAAGSSYGTAQQPFRYEVDAVAHTFLASNSPQQLSLSSTTRTSILRDLTHNTHPDVFMPAYEAAYDVLQSISLPRWMKLQEENIGWEKKLYWVLYGLCTFLVGWGIALGCVFGGVHVKREWRLWAVPFLCLGGMQMYAGYRGFCTQVWGRGGTQLRPWELVHPDHVTLVSHGLQDHNGQDEEQAEKTRSRAATVSSTSSSTKGKEKAGNDEVEIVSEVPIDAAEMDDVFPTSVTIPHEEAPLGEGESSSPRLRPSQRLQQLSTDLPTHPPSHARLSPLRVSEDAVIPSPVSGDGYKDDWGHPPAPPSSPMSPSTIASPTLPSPLPPPVTASQWPSSSTPSPPRASGKRTVLRLWRKVRRCDSARDVDGDGGSRHRDTKVEVEAEKSMSLRARVYGPERVVLDPRIKAVHRRVLRDILCAGLVCGVVCTVVVLVLPRR